MLIGRAVAISRRTLRTAGRLKKNRETACSQGLLLGLGCDNFLAAIKPVRTDMMKTVHLTGTGFHSQWRLAQKVVRSMLPAARYGFLILLNGHDDSPEG